MATFIGTDNLKAKIVNIKCGVNRSKIILYVYLYKKVYLVECETCFIIGLTNPVYNRITVPGP